MANRNLELLKVAAKLLGPVLDELVFVGGCATGLLVSDEAAAEVRPTFDVDAIAEITSYVEYTTFGERLHKLGFTEDASEGAPICRWQHGQIKLDLMPFGRKDSWRRCSRSEQYNDLRLILANKKGFPWLSEWSPKRTLCGCE